MKMSFDEPFLISPATTTVVSESDDVRNEETEVSLSSSITDTNGNITGLVGAAVLIVGANVGCEVG
jgi:hypothetical protein